MISSKIQLQGKYYSGEHPVAKSVMLTVGDSEVTLKGEMFTQTFGVLDLRISPRIAHADRFIDLPDGGQCQCPDHPLLDNLPQEVRSEGVIAWMEAHVPFAIASIVIIVGSIILGYMFGLPALAKIVAERIPLSTEASLGEEVLKLLDKKHWFITSTIDQRWRSGIREQFFSLYKDCPIAPHIKLAFRYSRILGPNAFALPGGIIVITDQMVNLAHTNDEIMAILAHELGHVEHRHSMRLILQSSFAALIATAVTADATSLSAAVLGIPTILVQKKYSRNFENIADKFAFDLLKHNSISPESFADIIERLEEQHGNLKPLSFLSTHPISAERIKHAREAAGSEN